MNRSAFAVLRRQRPMMAVMRHTQRRLASSASDTEPLQERPLTADQKTALGLNDERLIGDYPRVPKEYYHHRDPTVTYDDQLSKRNFDEPLYEYYDTVDVWSPDRFDQVSDSVALRNTGITVGLFTAFSLFVYFFSTHDEKPAKPRDYPHDGLYKALGATEKDKEEFQARPDPQY